MNKVSSFFHGFFSSKPMGDIWQGADASKAYKDGHMSSRASSGSLRIAFRNLSSVPLLLCWISENGKLHHFRHLHPASLDDGVRFEDMSTSTLIRDGDHIEHTCGGHSFCLAYLPDDGKRKKARRLQKLPDVSAIVGAYRPYGKGLNQIHLVTIGKGIVDYPGCGPSRLRRKRQRVTFVRDDCEGEGSHYSNSDLEWIVAARVATEDEAPFDTTTKFYELQTISGWPVYAEPNWFDGDLTLKKRLADDIEQVCKILPSHAVEYLKLNCPIWVNKSIMYGPKSCPVRGRACCYHPDKDWLIENGLSERKHMSIEINDGPGYMEDLDSWGPGGVMVHELSHAYHHQVLEDGYDNKEIMACYKRAMKEKLYERVRVHGPQGPEAEAYACTDQMEYFAELSTAFLGCKDGSVEYNKWFPFNREQLAAHDPRAFKMLHRVWKIPRTKRH